MKFQEYKIECDCKNIYYFLKDMGFAENFICNLRKEWGNLVVNDQIVNIRQPLRKGDILKINNNPNQKTTIMHCRIPLNVVYEDDYYLLINKPSGLPCMPSRSHYTSNLAGAICNYMKKEDGFVLRIINRLDKDTAGIIIVAKDSISQNKIKDIEKRYVAICEGEILKPLSINSPIKTINNNGVNEHKRIVSPDGKPATTFITPIASENKHSLLSIKLLHGRTHQIRVHLSSIGTPLLGDELYGKKSTLLNHTALICKEISFYHPYLQKTLSFQIDYPQDFEKAITILGLKQKTHIK